MADGEEQENQNSFGEDPFGDLEASITDSFSRLQQSIDAHADQMSEMQGGATDTLFSSDFLNSLNENLSRVADNQEQTLQQQEDLKTEYEQLNSNLSTVNTSLSDLQEDINNFSLAGTSFDFTPVRSSIQQLQSVFQERIQVLSQRIGEISVPEDLQANVEFNEGSIISSIRDLGSTLSERIQDVSLQIDGLSLPSELETDVEINLEPLQSSVQNLQSVFQGGFQILSEKIEEISIPSEIDADFEFDRSSLIAAISNLSTSFENQIQNLSSRLDDLPAEFETDVHFNLDPLRSSVQSLQSVVQGGIEDLGQKIGQISIPEQTEANVEFDESSIVSAIRDLELTLNAKASNIASKISGLPGPGAFDTNVSVNLEPLLSSIQSLQSVVQRGYQTLSQKIEGIEVPGEIQGNFEFGEASIVSAIENLKTSVNRKIQEVKGSLDGIKVPENLTAGVDLDPVVSSVRSLQSVVQGGFQTLFEKLSGVPESPETEANVDFGEYRLVSTLESIKLTFQDELQRLSANLSGISDFENVEAETNVDSIKSAVSEGVTEAMVRIEQQRMMQRGRNRAEPQTNEPQRSTTPTPVQTSVSIGDISVPNIGTGGIPRISNLLSGNVTLNQEFPEFLSELEARNKTLSEAISVTNQELAGFEGSLSDLIEAGGDVDEISIGDALGGDLKKNVEGYQQAIDGLFDKFTDVIGEQGEKLVSTTRNIIKETGEQLRFEQIQPDNLVGLVSRDLGYEEVYEQLETMAQNIENEFISSAANIAAGVEDQEMLQKMNQQVAGSMNQIFEVYQQLEQQDLNRMEIKQGLVTATEQIKEESQDLRESNEQFADQQDAVLSQLVESVDQVEKIKQKREAQNEVYSRYFGMLESVQDRYEDMQTLLSGIGEMMSSPKMWGLAALNGALALGYQIYDQILDVDESLRGVADNTGLVQENLSEVRDVVMDIQGPLMARGATLEQIAQSVGMIRSEMQGVNVTTERLGMSTEELSSAIVDVATGFNVSNEAAAEVLSTLQVITDATGSALEDTLIMTQQLATQRDVAPQAVFSDIRNASEEIAEYGEINARNIANAAVSARELGTNLNEVLGIAKNFRNDIVGSVQSLQQAELMLGQRIPAESLVSASFESPEAFTRELRNTMENLNLDLDGPLATYRLQSLSDAFGVSVQRLREMAESAEAAEKALESVPAGERIGVLNDKILASQTRFEAVTNRVTGFGKALLNLFAEPVINTIEPIMSELSLLLRNIMDRFGNLTDQYENVKNESLQVGEAFGVVQKELNKFGEGAGGMRAKTASLVDTVISFAESAYYAGKALVGLTDDIVTIVDAVTPLFEALNSVIQTFESLGETIGVGGGMGVVVGLASLYGGFKGLSAIVRGGVIPAVSSFIPSLASMGSYLDDAIPLTTRFSSTLSTTSSTMGSASKAAGTAGSAFSGLGTQLALTAGAVYIASEAMQNFAELSWGEITKGIVGMAGALGTMTLALRGMNTVLSTVNWATMAAAGGTMIAFAGATWILADAMEGFAEAGSEGLGVMAGAIGILSAFGGTLTALIGGTGGIGAGAALAAAGVVGAFGLALYGVAKAVETFADSAMKIGDAAEQIGKLENTEEIARKISSLTDALSSMSSISISNIFAGLVGEGVADQIQKIVELGRQADPLAEVANSVNQIADAAERLAQAEISGTLSQIEDVTSQSFGEAAGGAVQSITSYVSDIFSEEPQPQPTSTQPPGEAGIQTQATTGAVNVDPGREMGEATDTVDDQPSAENIQNQEEMIGLLQQIAQNENELLNALRNGEVAVYMDSDDVTDKVAKRSAQRNSVR